MKENTLFQGLDFSWDEIATARENGGLLSFDLELSLACNLRCLYCYAEAGAKKQNEMSLEEIYSVIDQAVDLGAKKMVIIGGGEPLLYNDYWDVLKKVREHNLQSITFTNGTVIDTSTAQKLYAHNEDVALKFNAMDEGIQDHLAGNIKGTGRKIKQALECLLEAGYSGEEGAPRLALETIVCRQNYDEIVPIYMFCRENNLTPYVEILNVQGSAKKNRDLLEISPSDAYQLFKTLQEYDERTWGIEWPLIPPIAGQTCKRMYYSAYITATGDVQPCPGVDISSGNIRDQKLETIISESEIFNAVRYIDRNISDPCKTCRFSEQFKCYGCRGAALHQSGHYLDADPTCWWGCEKGEYAYIHDIEHEDPFM